MTFSSLNTCIVITQLEDLHSAVSSGVPFTLPAWLTTGFRTFQFNCQFVNWNKYLRLVSLCSRMLRKRWENPQKGVEIDLQDKIFYPTPFTTRFTTKKGLSLHSPCFWPRRSWWYSDDQASKGPPNPHKKTTARSWQQHFRKSKTRFATVTELKPAETEDCKQRCDIIWSSHPSICL